MDQIPKDKLLLVKGTVENNGYFEWGHMGEARGWTVAYWDSVDEAFCTFPGDWTGPFVKDITEWKVIEDE